MAKLGFKDFLAVDYAPGMPDLIKKNAKKRKQDTTGGTNAEYSSTHPPRKEQKVHDPIGGGKHAPNVGMGWTGKHKTIKDPATGKHVHVFQYTEETELDEVSKDDEQAVHKMLNSRSAEDLLKVYKKLYKKEYLGTSKSELVSKIKSKVRNYKHAFELMKEEVKLDEYNTKSSKVIVTKDNKPVAIYSDLKSAQKDYHGKDGHAIGMRSHSAAMRIKKENPGIKIVESVEELDEALTSQQRRARARLFKKYKARIKLGKERAKRRFASPEKLKLRARRKARDFIFRRITKDIPKSELTFARRQEIEKRLESPAVKKRIERLAIKFLPRVRKAEMEKKRKGSPKK